MFIYGETCRGIFYASFPQKKFITFWFKFLEKFIKLHIKTLLKYRNKIIQNERAALNSLTIALKNFNNKILFISTIKQVLYTSTVS